MDPRDVLPEELAALEELARLLEQYQTYLIAGHAFADSVRAQASNASGTARPVLERLHGRGPAGVAQLEGALRVARTDEERKTVLDELGAALKDLRALIATARWRKSSPSTVTPVPVAPAEVAAVAVNPAVAPSKPRTNALTRDRFRIYLWVGSGVLAGLVLGAFGTQLPRSASALSRLWILLQPVIATGSGAVMGGLLMKNGLRDFRETLRSHWLALVVSSVLLIVTAPTAVDAARDLFGAGGNQTSGASPAVPSSAPGSTVSTTAPSASVPSPSGPGTTAPNGTPAAARTGSAAAPSPAAQTTTTTPAQQGPVGGSAVSSPTPTAPSGGRAIRETTPPRTGTTPPRPGTGSEECRRLTEKLSLEPLTDAELQQMKIACGK